MSGSSTRATGSTWTISTGASASTARGGRSSTTGVSPFFFQAEDGIRDPLGLEFRRVLFRSKTLNVVRREEAAEQVRQWGGDRVVLQGDNLQKDIEEALDRKKLSLVLDTVGGTPVGELAR